MKRSGRKIRISPGRRRVRVFSQYEEELHAYRRSGISSLLKPRGAILGVQKMPRNSQLNIGRNYPTGEFHDR
jgi:hypothetical protein